MTLCLHSKERRNPAYTLYSTGIIFEVGASLNLSNVYVSCYTHMQMELYCSQPRRLLLSALTSTWGFLQGGGFFLLSASSYAAALLGLTLYFWTFHVS